ncbi:hypothetical protein GQ43DRAFT_435775 [Delitschia confertaspora ATCC 74209]|uniref:Uncharacterized protein n=1 Tax=Delitschia confertaspora ATCC 74209 TaxID=1513339 RepID=A0A9P4MN81_9PLEO|nr:hypothetical protein GQ43DRAFT_435775 [Delitschia confertaspora ATCC 74209]
MASPNPHSSLGDSWGQADYESQEEEASITESEKEESELENKATPVPKRMTPASSWTSPNTPVRTPLRKSRSQKSPKSQQWAKNSPSSSRKGSNPVLAELSLIMPSMDSSTDGFSSAQATPSRNSTMPRRLPKRALPNMSSTQFPQPPSSKKAKVQANLQDNNQSPGLWLWSYMVRPSIEYALSVLGWILTALKLPIVAYLCLFLILKGVSFMGQSFLNNLSPVCSIPGSSYLIPFCATIKVHNESSQPPPFEDLVKVQSHFEDVLQVSSSGFTLPSDMKRSEASIRDLNTLVKFSKLPSKAELEVEMQTFISSAREVANDLAKFNSRINRAVDTVLSTNRWTLQILEGLANKEASRGSIERFVSNFNPISTFMSPPVSLQQKVFEQYLHHTTVVEQEISHLIVYAQSLLRQLNDLDDQIANIGHIAARDTDILTSNKDEILSFLWTKLGGNRGELSKHNGQLRLLQEVSVYRSRAWGHIASTLLKLQSIAVGLEDLRERIAMPGVVGHRAEFPLPFYLDLIEQGAERLQEVRGETRDREREAMRVLASPDLTKGLPAGRESVNTVLTKSRN